MMEEKGKINEYVCARGHVTRTGNLDPGVTPFMICCTHEGCEESAQSRMYMCDQLKIPEYVWYRPELHEWEREVKEACEKLKAKFSEFDESYEDGLRCDMFKHVALGGLHMRKCNGKADLNKLNHK